MLIIWDVTYIQWGTVFTNLIFLHPDVHTFFIHIHSMSSQGRLPYQVKNFVKFIRLAISFPYTLNTHISKSITFFLSRGISTPKLLTAEPGSIGLYHVLFSKSKDTLFKLHCFLTQNIFFFSYFPALRSQWSGPKKNWHKKCHFRFQYFSTDDRLILYYKSQG